MSERRLILELDSGVAHIRLLRPEAANSIDLDFAKEFEATAQACKANEVRAVLISAVGHQFCAVGDIKTFVKVSNLETYVELLTAHLHSGIETLVLMDAPTVVAVEGAVAGAGMGLVCAADIVVAGESATFVMAFTRLGLTPDGSTSWFLPRHIGLRRAVDLTLTNRVLTAGEALERGIVSRVAERGQALSDASAIVDHLRRGPTAAYAASKRLLRSSFENSLQAQFQFETASQVERVRSHDGAEGLYSFVERRSPVFEGR